MRDPMTIDALVSPEQATGSYDVAVIGAGFSGLYATWRLKTAGHTVHSFESADDVGDVRTWNRCPGACADSLRRAHQPSSDRGSLLNRTDPDFHLTQPEDLEYLSAFADEYDVRRHYSFNTTVAAAHWDESVSRWNFLTETGETATARYFVTGLGPASAPLGPDTSGSPDSEGEVRRTSRTPKEAIGAFTRIDIRGQCGVSLADRWNAEGPKTFLGLAVHGFPNLLLAAGPQNPFADLPPGVQAAGNWIADYLTYAEACGFTTSHPTKQAQEDWNDHVRKVQISRSTSHGKDAGSGAVGANTAGKSLVCDVCRPEFKEHVDRCDAEAAADYPNMVGTRAGVMQ